jgi:hypothetical protein
MGKLLLKLSIVVTCVVGLFFYASQSIDPDGRIRRIITPTPTVTKIDPTVIVKEIQKLARLETAVVNSERIVKGERNQEQLWGHFGETMTFVAYGQVVAGIDLSNFTKNGIVVVDTKTIKVKLPKAKIFSVIIDNQKSYVASRDKGFLAYSDKDMESKVRLQAQIDCESNALNQGILDEANANAKNFIEDLLLGLGFETVLSITD